MGSNRRRSVALVAAVSLLIWLPVVLLGAIVGHPLLAGAISLALTVSVLWSLVSGSEGRVLSAVAAEPADPHDHARLHNLVEGLSVLAGVPKPALCVVTDPALNALTTASSPSRATLVATTGLLGSLTRVELEAVIAQQLCLIRSLDTRLATLTMDLVARPSAVAGSHLMARGIRAAMGTGRDAAADARAARLTRYPPALISALAKLDASGTVVARAPGFTAHLWLAAPVDASPSSVAAGQALPLADPRFSTHLALRPRIALLEEL